MSILLMKTFKKSKYNTCSLPHSPKLAEKPGVMCAFALYLHLSFWLMGVPDLSCC